MAVRDYTESEPVMRAANTIARALARGEGTERLGQRYPEQLGHLSPEDYSTALGYGDVASDITTALRDLPFGAPISDVRELHERQGPLGLIQVYVPFKGGAVDERGGHGRTKVLEFGLEDSLEDVYARARDILDSLPASGGLGFRDAGEEITYIPFDLYEREE